MVKKLQSAFLLALFISGITFAQSPAVDNLYRIALNGTAITVDGDLSDWDDAQWEFLSIDRPAYGILNSISNSGIYPASPSDASAWLAIKMDDNNIYFALNVRDENAPLFAGADDAAKLNLYDNLNVFLGLYDIGANAYSSPHLELMNGSSGANLVDPTNQQAVNVNSTYRISGG